MPTVLELSALRTIYDGSGHGQRKTQHTVNQMATRTTAQRTNVGTNGIRAMHVRLNDTASFPKKGREQTKTKNKNNKTKRERTQRTQRTQPAVLKRFVALYLSVGASLTNDFVLSCLCRCRSHSSSPLPVICVCVCVASSLRGGHCCFPFAAAVVVVVLFIHSLP